MHAVTRLYDMIQTIKRLLSPSTAESVVECRNCGASVDPDSECCPRCGSSEIASYEIGA
ncbi:hypothetical protein GCM10008985_21430 [Halococcus dombrowskii]|uniref:Zinc-ribbon domain-containing protein n=1 Tax=Halococcus dombrowskii TaxID=179637 RepID=A0AAV3SHP8_HALDO